MSVIQPNAGADPNLNVQQPAAQDQQPPVQVKKEIPPEASRDVHFLPSGAIPDEFIASKMKEFTGEEFNPAFASKRDDFKISCGFANPKDPKTDHRDMYTFNKNGEEYFGVQRFVTVQWSEGNPKEAKEITFAFNIELGLKVPVKKPKQSNKEFNDAMQQGMYMAGIAGKMAAEPWELMTQNRVGQAKGEKWNQLKPHIDKIRNDRFVTLELLHDGKAIKMNAKDTFKERRIHQVDIHVRSGKATLAASGDDLEDPRAHITSFQSNLYKSHAERGNITFADKFKPRKWHLSSEPLYSNQRETSQAVKKFSDAQRIDLIQEELGEDKLSLKEILHKKDLKPLEFEGSLESQRGPLQKELNDYLYMLSDASALQSLVHEFGGKNPPNFTNNDFIQANFKSVEKTPPATLVEKAKAKIRPKETPVPNPGNVLNELLRSAEKPNLNEAQLKDLRAIANSSKKALDKMKKIDIQLKENEHLLKETLNLRDNSKAVIKDIEQNAKKRTETIENCEQILARADTALANPRVALQEQRPVEDEGGPRLEPLEESVDESLESLVDLEEAPREVEEEPVELEEGIGKEVKNPEEFTKLRMQKGKKGRYQLRAEGEEEVKKPTAYIPPPKIPPLKARQGKIIPPSDEDYI